MFLSELNYAHLLAEHEAAITRDLELRRRALERQAEEGAAVPAPPRGWRQWNPIAMLRMPRRTRDAIDPCPTCPSPA